MPRNHRLLVERSQVCNALKVSLVVGTVLNLLNQGQAILQGDYPDGWRLLLNYLVPFGVSLYSAVKNGTKHRNAE